jgi:transposase-like protein
MTEEKIPRQQYTQEQIDRALSLRAEGFAWKEIMVRLGIPEKRSASFQVTISNIKANRRTPENKIVQYKAERSRLAEEYLNSDISIAELARRNGISKRAMNRKLALEGVGPDVRKVQIPVPQTGSQTLYTEKQVRSAISQRDLGKGWNEILDKLGIPREKIDSFKSVVSKTRNGLRSIENTRIAQFDARRKLAKEFMESDAQLADFAREVRQKRIPLRRRLSKEGVRFR